MSSPNMKIPDGRQLPTLNSVTPLTVQGAIDARKAAARRDPEGAHFAERLDQARGREDVARVAAERSRAQARRPEGQRSSRSAQPDRHSDTQASHHATPVGRVRRAPLGTQAAPTGDRLDAIAREMADQAGSTLDRVFDLAAHGLLPGGLSGDTPGAGRPAYVVHGAPTGVSAPFESSMDIPAAAGAGSGSGSVQVSDLLAGTSLRVPGAHLSASGRGVLLDGPTGGAVPAAVAAGAGLGAATTDSTTTGSSASGSTVSDSTVGGAAAIDAAGMDAAVLVGTSPVPTGVPDRHLSRSGEQTDVATAGSTAVRTSATVGLTDAEISSPTASRHGDAFDATTLVGDSVTTSAAAVDWRPGEAANAVTGASGATAGLRFTNPAAAMRAGVPVTAEAASTTDSAHLPGAPVLGISDGPVGDAVSRTGGETLISAPLRAVSEQVASIESARSAARLDRHGVERATVAPSTAAPKDVLPTSSALMGAAPGLASDQADTARDRTPSVLPNGLDGLDGLDRLTVDRAPERAATTIVGAAQSATDAFARSAADAVTRTTDPAPGAPSAAEAPTPIQVGTTAVPPAGQATPASAVSAGGSVPAPLPHQQIMHAMTPVLRRPDGTYQVEIDLTPEHLGSVKVNVEMRAGEIVVSMTAADTAGRDSLRDGLDDLRRMLEAQGGRQADVSVADQRGGFDPGQRQASGFAGGTTSGGSHPGGHPGTAGAPRGATGESPETDHLTGAIAGADSALDLRV